MEAIHRMVTGPFLNPLHVDFSKLEYICPESCLLLASEIYLWKLRAKKKLRVLSESWNPYVLELFRDMGYFDLLELPALEGGNIERNIRFLPFKTGSHVNGEDARDLRIELERLVGDKIPRPQLYSGLTEAITNTVQHAYPTGVANRWWISGSYDSSNSELRVMSLDRGVGIPQTLPKSDRWEAVRSYLGSAGLVSDHGHLIRAAVTSRRSSTGLAHRGRGLGQFLEFSNEFNQSKLQIISGRGRYERIRHGPNSESELVRDLQRPFVGTLVSWRATIE